MDKLAGRGMMRGCFFASLYHGLFFGSAVVSYWPRTTNMSTSKRQRVANTCKAVAKVLGIQPKATYYKAYKTCVGERQ